MDYLPFLRLLLAAPPVNAPNIGILETDDLTKKIRGQFPQGQQIVAIGLGEGSLHDEKSDNKQDREEITLAIIQKAKPDDLDSLISIQSAAKYTMMNVVAALIFKRKTLELHHFEPRNVRWRYVYHYHLADYHGIECTFTLGHSVNQDLFYTE